MYNRSLDNGRGTVDNTKQRTPRRHTMICGTGLWLKMWSPLIVKYLSVMARLFVIAVLFVIRSHTCRVVFHHVVIGSIMWISVPSHREWSDKFCKLPTSIAHTFSKYTILYLFLDTMLLFLDATVDVLFYLQHYYQGISHSSALNECVSKSIVLIIGRMSSLPIHVSSRTIMFRSVP